MNKILSSEIFKNLQTVALAAFSVKFVYILFQQHSIFPDHWFPSHFSALTFMFLFFAWIFSEFINSLWSRRNSLMTNKDKGSYRIVVMAAYLALIIVFVLRNLEIGVFSGSLQDIGLILLVIGIVLREWSIWTLGRYFTVRVQVSEEATLVTKGPYKNIRHPAYTGSLLTFVGISLAIGSWLGAIIALIVKLIAIEYRIRVEEDALEDAFGSQYEEYKKRTWKLFPGF
jgi:protein-S-isoprenylcysteine O-methyltransferase Ste14